MPNSRHDGSTDFDPNIPNWQATPVGGPLTINNSLYAATAADSVAKTVSEPRSALGGTCRSYVSRPGSADRTSRSIIE